MIINTTTQIVVYKQPPALSPPNTSPGKLDFSTLLHEAAGRKGTSCDRRRVCKLAESAISGSNCGTTPHGSWNAEKKTQALHDQNRTSVQGLCFGMKDESDVAALFSGCFTRCCVRIAPIRLIIKKIIVKKLRHRKLIDCTPIFLRRASRSASPIHKAADLT